jgi:hypothetical protein
MNLKQSKALAAHFEAMHKNPPPPFNPNCDPKVKERWQKVIMLADAQAKREGVSTVPAERKERVLELREMYDNSDFTEADYQAALNYYWED